MCADPSRLPEGREYRLAGTVGLSFSRDTREAFPTLQPPDGAAYLSNMAVDPSFRRCAAACSMVNQDCQPQQRKSHDELINVPLFPVPVSCSQS